MLSFKVQVKTLLEKLFTNSRILQNLGPVQIALKYDLEFVRLYLLWKSQQEGKNQILLSKEFIHPELDVWEISKNVIPVSAATKEQRIPGSRISQNNFVEKLVSFGYSKQEQVYDQMQFSQRGDTFLVYTNTANLVYRIEFFYDIVEKISLVDNTSFRFISEQENIVLVNVNPEEKSFQTEIIGNNKVTLTSPIVYSDSALHLPGFDLSSEQTTTLKSIPLFHKNAEVFSFFARDFPDYEFFYIGHFQDLIPEGFKKFLSKELNFEKLPITLSKGFVEVESKIVILTDYEILSTLNLAKAKEKKYSKFTKLFENEINIGDYIVHEAHGIGQYRGIESKLVLGEINEYVVIEYLNQDKLLIPLNQLSRISKYVSADNTEPRVTKLGTAEWESIRRKLKKSVEDIAKELLEIYAKKNMEKGIEFDFDTTDQEKFEADCDFTLTEDQIRTLNEVKGDMESSKPMDRLIIGDVGFGKTEIALRAAFKAVSSGKQVLVLAPTTVLVAQLHHVFTKRLEKYPFRIGRVSRFDGTIHNKSNIKLAAEDKIDILIGTHRLLSEDVKIPNLGLLIIDEEQRFGVKQKEKIRKLRTNIDLLSMSATPIPRTLQMALTGIKDISIIATPPLGRLSVHNEVIFIEEIAEKIAEELKRNGQVFVVHNKIEDIETFAAQLQQQLPSKATIAVGHGRMTGEKLEKIMYEFSEKKYDILIATTIIENGIDIPNVNTMIVDNAHQFGLSQLYQLRGRVGRGKVQGYCYLVLPKVKEFINLHKNPTKELLGLKKMLEENKVEDKWLTPESVARIQAILDNQELGAGFKIASRDLEIRGSGNILGTEQSGQINAVGYEMYIRLLEQEIERIRSLNASLSTK